MKRTLTLVIGILAALFIVAGCDTGTQPTEPVVPPADEPSAQPPPAAEPVAVVEPPPAEPVPAPDEPVNTPSPQMGVTESYAAKLTPANQVPPVSTVASGEVTATLDGSTLTLSGTFSGLGSAVTMSHIHFGGINENGPVVVPIQVTTSESMGSNEIGNGTGTSGTISLTTSLDSTQLAQLENGFLYVNVHSQNYPDGEIRGHLLLEGSPGLTADTSAGTDSSAGGVPMETTGSTTGPSGSTGGSTGTY